MLAANAFASGEYDDCAAAVVFSSAAPAEEDVDAAASPTVSPVDVCTGAAVLPEGSGAAAWPRRRRESSSYVEARTSE
jgi:hypothetical protein